MFAVDILTVEDGGVGDSYQGRAGVDTLFFTIIVSVERKLTASRDHDHDIIKLLTLLTLQARFL